MQAATAGVTSAGGAAPSNPAAESNDSASAACANACRKSNRCAAPVDVDARANNCTTASPAARCSGAMGAHAGDKD